MNKSTGMKTLWQPTTLLMLCAVLAAIVTGVLSIAFVNFSYQKIGVLLGLPAAMVLGFMFLFHRHFLFLLIMLTRSMLDPIFHTTKLGAFGLGAALNALVIMIAGIALIQSKGPVRRIAKVIWLPFLLFFAFSTAIAPDKLAAIKTYLSTVSYAAVFVLAIVLVETREDYSKWVKVILLSSLIPVLYAFYQVAAGYGHGAEGLRIKSTFSHFNIFAFYLVLMISLAFFLMKTQLSILSPTVRRILPFYLLMLLAALVLTKTRSAWIACYAFFFIYGLLYERKYFILMLLAPAFAMLIPDIRDRLLDLTSNNQVYTYSKLNSYAWRKYIWESGFNWMEPIRYIFGYGTDSFMYHSLDFFPLAGGIQRGAHSMYVQMFFEGGVIGLMTYWWTYLKMGFYIWPYYREHKMMVFIAIMLLFEYALFAYSDNMIYYLNFNWYFWFILGAGYSLAYHESKQKQAQDTGITERSRAVMAHA